MRDGRSQLSITAVMVILGLLVVAQFRAQEEDPGLAGLSAQDLTVLIANLNTGNDQLEDEIARLEQRLRELTAAEARGETSVEAIADDLARIRAWAGLEAVEGDGVRISIVGDLAGAGVEYLINELRNGGAEAIAIAGVRLVPGVVVSGPAGDLEVEGRSLPATFDIDAIGDPRILAGTLTRLGGPIAQLGATYPDVTLTVSEIEELVLPATTRNLVPRNGQPSL
jgi:uncharacterized protein YlxW (UPF0749 family)